MRHLHFGNEEMRHLKYYLLSHFNFIKESNELSVFAQIDSNCLKIYFNCLKNWLKLSQIVPFFTDIFQMVQIGSNHCLKSSQNDRDLTPMIYYKNFVFLIFLDASMHLYKRVCPSVHGSVMRFFLMSR